MKGPYTDQGTKRAAMPYKDDVAHDIIMNITTGEFQYYLSPFWMGFKLLCFVGGAEFSEVVENSSLRRKISSNHSAKVLKDYVESRSLCLACGARRELGPRTLNFILIPRELYCMATMISTLWSQTRMHTICALCQVRRNIFLKSMRYYFLVHIILE